MGQWQAGDGGQLSASSAERTEEQPVLQVVVAH